MTRPARVLKSDIKRAVAALEAVGKVVVGVKFPPEGGFEVLTVAPGDPADAPRKGGNGWDDVLSAA